METQVYGYVRVSTTHQKEKGYGADTQEKMIKDYCLKNNLTLMKIFKDLGISGTTVDREGLAELIGSINGVNKIIVLNTSRLWRNDTAKVLIKRELEKLKADVISVEQPTYSIYTKDPNDYLINGIMEVLDQYDRMHISLKLARGRKTKVRQGIKGCGTAALGYKWSHDSKKPEIVIDNEKAEIVKIIFSQYLTLKSLNKLGKYLNTQNYLSNTGKPFAKQCLALILSNEFYVGTINWGDLKVEGSHPSIISKCVFGKVQALMKRNRKR